jgi:hypothetical protein
MPRKIEEVYELTAGLVALSNDGKLFLLPRKSPRSPAFKDEWETLPAVPQSGYKAPVNEEIDGIVKTMQKAFTDIFSQMNHMGHHHHGMSHGPDSDKCPIEGCDFRSKDVAEMTAHLTKAHAS